MLTRMTIILHEEERQALRLLAEREFRTPRDEVTLILRQELQNRGLLTAYNTEATSITPRVAIEGEHAAATR